MSATLAAGPTAQTGLLDLERELLCSICTETLHQPLTLIDCLHTFCGSCLKEWFNFEYNKSRTASLSSRSNPYTCPTCRAQVKDARHNATVNTLLEMFLAANPGRGKSEQDKAEIAKSYKPGENILLALDPGGGKRSRRRGEEDRTEEAERRQLNDARERSIREFGGTAAQVGSRLAAPTSDGRNSRSRSQESRDRGSRDSERREERRERRRRAEAAEAQLREREAPASTNPTAPTVSLTTENLTNVQLSPPATSLRHPSAIEARQRERQIVPQTSLRSLMSSSESGAGTGDSLEAEQILHQIIDEGLLEGINLHDLNPAQEDALSERIAEAYRQRHRSRGEPSSGLATREESRGQNGSSRARTRIRDRQREAEGTGHQRSYSAQGSSSTETRRQARPEDSRLQVSRTGRADAGTSTPHGRRDFEHDRRPTSPLLTPEVGRHHASRSAIDLSGHDRAGTNGDATRSRLLSDTRRTNTGPEPILSVSERWRRTAEAEESGLPGDHPAQMGSQASSRAQNGATPVSTAAGSKSRSTNPAVEVEAPIRSVQHLPQPTAVVESTAPSISCASCSRPDIQHDLHKHCSRCSANVCLRCCRTVRSIAFGCDPNSMLGSAPNISVPTSPTTREAHLLTSRKYMRPDGVGRTIASDQAGKDDASSSLQEGKFCDLCHSFADHCYWSCDTCNRGDWGFCNSCINSHRCCTHPLLPLAHKLHAPKTPTLQQGQNADSGVITLSPSNLHADVLPNASGRRPASVSSSCVSGTATANPDYLPLTFTTNCDFCTYPIPPSHTRFHCPSHADPKAEPNGGGNSLGDYDICTNCYLNLVKVRQVRKEDGPNGWRKCPQGHRMIVIGFEDAPEGQKRIVVHDLVGGHSIRDADLATGAPTTNNHTNNAATPSSPSTPRSGQWSWLSNTEDGTLKRETRASRLRRNTNTTTNSTTTTTTTTTPNPTPTTPPTSPPSSFPPDGGTGMRVLAIHPWYPEEGEAGQGELMFPRWAEVREVEDVNGDWWAGVYGGVGGVFPAGCGRVVGSG